MANTGRRRGSSVMRRAANTGGGKEDAIRRLLAALESTTRLELARKIGSAYGGRRDIYGTAGYPETITFQQYWNLYERGDIAGRIVDMQPKTTWRTPPKIVELDADGPTPFVEAVEQLATRLRLWARFRRTDQLAGVGRYAVLLIGVPGTDQDLKNEMPRLKGPQDVLYTQAYHEEDAWITEWETDTASPRFGLPKFYEIALSVATGNVQALRAKVHWSRVIHAAEDCLRDDVYGRPRLQRSYNRLYDLEKVAASTGEAYWQLASRILSATTGQGAQIPEKLRTQLMEELEEVIHDLRRIFVGQEMDLKWLESQPPRPDEAANLYFMLVAASAGIPKRILFGSETGERASEQDMRQYHGTINERQEQFAEPGILRPFIDRLVVYGGLPSPGEKGYGVIWPALTEETDSERATANLTRAQAAAALTPIGGDPLEIVEIDEDGRVRLRSAKETFSRRASEEGTVPPPSVEDTAGGEA